MLDEGRLIAPEGARARQVERILYLQKVSAIQGLPMAQLALVADQMRERIYPKGEVILREGQAVDAITFVVAGKIHINRQGRPVGHVGVGASVGALWVLGGKPSTLEVSAETDTLTLQLPAEVVTELLEENFAMLHQLLRELSLQLIALILRSGQEGRGFRYMTWVPPDRQLDLVERIFFMRQSSPFRRASINALAEVSRAFSEVSYEPGTVIWRPGEPGGWVALLIAGTVRCQPPERPAFDLGPGAPLGSMEALAAVPRFYEATALTPVRALQGNMQTLLDVFEDNFEMARDYVAVIAQWLVDGLERAAENQNASVLKLYGFEDTDAHEA